MLQQDPKEYMQSVISKLKSDLVSVITSPHPYTRFVVLFIFKDEVQLTPEILSSVYHQAPVPPDTYTGVYALHRCELPELAYPYLRRGDFGREHPHLLIWLKRRGTVLFGEDLRDELPLPNLQEMVPLMAYPDGGMRMHVFLQNLRFQNSQLQAYLFNRVFCHVMGMALMRHEVWDVTYETIPQRYLECFPSQRESNFWPNLQTQLGILRSEESTPEAKKQASFEAIWLWETFLQRARQAIQ